MCQYILQCSVVHYRVCLHFVPLHKTIRGVKSLGVEFIFFWLRMNLAFIFLPNLCGHGVLSETLFSRFLGFQLFDHFHVTVQILHLSKFILKLDSLIQMFVHTGTFFFVKQIVSNWLIWILPNIFLALIPRRTENPNSFLSITKLKT